MNEQTDINEVLAPFFNKRLDKVTFTEEGLILWFEGGVGLMLYNVMGRTCIAQTEDLLN